MAKAVWSHFGAKIHISYRPVSLSQFIMRWLQMSSRRSQLGYSLIVILFYGLWQIWKARCSAKYEEIRWSSCKVKRAIYEHIYNMNLMHTPKRIATHWENNILEKLRVPVKKGQWIAWNKPEQGMIKVHTDGSRKNTSTAGGGVLRDAAGFFLHGFAAKFASQDILRVERN